MSEFAQQVEIKGHTYSVKDPVVVHTHLGKKLAYVTKINSYRHMMSVSFPESQASSMLQVTFGFEKFKPCTTMVYERNQLLVKVQQQLLGASDKELADLASLVLKSVAEYKANRFFVHSC